MTHCPVTADLNRHLARRAADDAIEEVLEDACADVPAYPEDDAPLADWRAWLDAIEGARRALPAGGDPEDGRRAFNAAEAFSDACADAFDLTYGGQIEDAEERVAALEVAEVSP